MNLNEKIDFNDYLQTIRILLEDHHKHPLSMPKSMADIQYSHLSSSSSWCHFLENKKCNDYLLLFSLITLAELSRHGLWIKINDFTSINYVLKRKFVQEILKIKFLLL